MAPTLEVSASRTEQVGGVHVRRALPRPRRRTVGAWCFADHLGPASVTEGAGPDVGPHPHIGLQTVTWLLDGELLHRDSLGSEQVIRPGQVNLMTAGAGVTHAEEATGHYRGTLEGIQLWIAQADATRTGPAAFAHHADLPRLQLDGGEATMLVGALAGVGSLASTDSSLVGAELTLPADSTLPLQRDWEYALIVLRGAVYVEGRVIEPGHLGWLGVGRDELAIGVRGRATVLLIGGEPFTEPLMMWWNFVARSRAEIDAAYDAWMAQDAGRFGAVDSRLPIIAAAPPFWRE